jgi:uncharacterized protein YycO
LGEGVRCRALLPCRITCEERLPSPASQPEPHPGDIWITNSTHTLGWRHGHAALAIDSQTLLEAAMPGVPSGYSSPESWATYPSLHILRVKETSPELQETTVSAAKTVIAAS